MLACAISLVLFNTAAEPPEVEIPTIGHAGYMRCEPSIAAQGSNVLVSWNDSVGGERGSSTGVAVGWAYSTDSGQSYKVGGYLADDGGKLQGADSRVAATPDGGFILLILGGAGIHLYEMKKMGVLRDLGLAARGPDLDKPALAVDGKRIAVAFTKGTGEICVVRSSDGGATFGAVVTVSSQKKMNRSGVSLAFQDKALRVAWMEGAKFVATEACTASASSWDGAFQPAPTAYHLESAPAAPEGQVMAGFRDGAYSQFCYDTSLTVTKQGLQLSLVEGSSSGSRVLSLRSSDGGESWSKPIEVSALFAAGSNAYAAVCPRRNDIVALYYHQEAKALDGATDVLMTSLSHDASFSARVSSKPTPWKTVLGDAKRSPFQRVFGDYISVANNGKDEIFAAWTDGRAGYPTIMVRHLKAFPSVRRVS